MRRRRHRVVALPSIAVGFDMIARFRVRIKGAPRRSRGHYRTICASGYRLWLGQIVAKARHTRLIVPAYKISLRLPIAISQSERLPRILLLALVPLLHLPTAFARELFSKLHHTT